MSQKLVFTDWKLTGLGAPVQIEGTDAASGLSLYYRERRGEWRVELDGETVAEGEGGEAETDTAELNKMLAPHGISFGRQV